MPKNSIIAIIGTIYLFSLIGIIKISPLTEFLKIVTLTTPMLSVRFQMQFYTRKDSSVSTFFAYIDPITGSLVFQLLVLGFMAVLAFFKRVNAFVLGLFGIKTTVESIDDAEDAQTVRLDESNNDQRKAA